MKSLICSLLVCSAVFLTPSCNKIIEDKQKDFFLEAMTDGQWYIHSYMEGTTFITEQFQDFIFQFHENGTITSTRGEEVKMGTWKGDISNYSITSVFPETERTLAKLNGSWMITSASSTFVRAEMTNLSGKIILELKKT